MKTVLLSANDDSNSDEEDVASVKCGKGKGRGKGFDAEEGLKLAEACVQQSTQHND